MKYSGIGGQAVIEGVMMKNQDEYAIAVRKPDHNIEVKKQPCKSLRNKYKAADLPIIRGVISFVESLTMGMSTLNYSASFYEEEEEKMEKSKEQKEKDEKKDNIIMAIVMVFAFLFAIGVFFLVPFFVSEALRKTIPSLQLRGLIEGVIRVFLFVLYVKLISFMEDIKRVFMYHGAEHKCISCIETGHELTLENVRKSSMVHKRCGTSFMLIVMFISILLFMFIVVDNIWLRMVFRILLIPVIAGLSYEFIRFAGKHDNPVINILSKPGLMLQSLTTKEPTDDMIEVAMASVNAVFDWSEFLAHYDEPDEEEKKKEKTEENEDTANTVETEETEQTEETAAAKEETVSEKTPVEEKSETDIEIVSIDDEEDDEILNALDRYFEMPEEKSE